MSVRVPFIAGNWKMNMLGADARALAAAVAAGAPVGVRAAVCPPFTALAPVLDATKGSAVAVGAQNCHAKANGAFTGEVAAAMLADLGVHYVILGHSERRQYFGETDAGVNEKVKAALDAGLKAIVCVGELEQERVDGLTAKVIDTQVRGCLAGLSGEQMSQSVTIAYEPVWAIGTGRTATPEMAQEVHGQIRGLLVELFGAAAASQVVIQYGGSMNPANADALLAQPDIDGGLIGGASLKAESFLALLESAAKRLARLKG